jgi:hypothetical protein
MTPIPVVFSLVFVVYGQFRRFGYQREGRIGARAMTQDPHDETDAEQRHRLWWGIRRAGPVQWVSICIVLAMVAAVFWLAIHFSKPAAF